MWDDRHDWFNVWLEPGQTLLLTLSHASGDGVSMSVWDEENTHLGVSNPSKTRDTIFLDEDDTDMGGAYSVSINATMTEAGAAHMFQKLMQVIQYNGIHPKLDGMQHLSNMMPMVI